MTRTGGSSRKARASAMRRPLVGREAPPARPDRRLEAARKARGELRHARVACGGLDLLAASRRGGRARCSRGRSAAAGRCRSAGPTRASAGGQWPCRAVPVPVAVAVAVAAPVAVDAARVGQRGQQLRSARWPSAPAPTTATTPPGSMVSSASSATFRDGALGHQLVERGDRRLDRGDLARGLEHRRGDERRAPSPRRTAAAAPAPSSAASDASATGDGECRQRAAPGRGVTRKRSCCLPAPCSSTAMRSRARAERAAAHLQVPAVEVAAAAHARRRRAREPLSTLAEPVLGRAPRLAPHQRACAAAAARARRPRAPRPRRQALRDAAVQPRVGSARGRAAAVSARSRDAPGGERGGVAKRARARAGRRLARAARRPPTTSSGAGGEQRRPQQRRAR